MSLPAGQGRDAEREQLIEDFGLHIGRAMGWPPMAGRAAGVLMLSDRPLTLTQLQEALSASKGSVSEMTRLLMVNGTVQRIKQPGQRQLLYEWRDDAWIGCLQHQLQQTTELLALATSSVARGAQLPREQRGRLREMHEYYSFIVERLEGLLSDYTSRWESRR
jgi:DNA-binding transcriptional regulator GbsR (MarR family)